MKLKTKILILAMLFAIQSVLYLLNAILVLSGGGSYSEYGNSFVYAGIFGYITYMLHTTRDKWAYWTAAVFIGFAIIRFVFGGTLIAWSGITPSVSQSILIVFFVLLFGIAPLVLLLDKQIRAEFLQK